MRDGKPFPRELNSNITFYHGKYFVRCSGQAKLFEFYTRIATSTNNFKLAKRVL